MRIAIPLIIVIALIMAGVLLRDSGGRGAGMFIFAFVVVILLSALPVILGRLATRPGADIAAGTPPTVANLEGDEPPSASAH